jgi:C1A family cysteine protease
MKRLVPVIILFVCVAGGLFSQAAPKSALGMEPTPKNFDAAIPSATARAGQTALPAQVDLSARFPKPGYQGEQNSCVAWATGYAVKSYQENRKRNWGVNSDDTVFSPSFIYNQINKGRDGGSTIPDALELVKSQGAATLKTMPYGDFRQQPGSPARQEAALFKAESYERLDGTNTTSLKTLLAGGNPIIIGMKTYDNFMTYSGGVYKSVSGAFLGGHAMVVVGYDDSKQAFKIMNSWSDRWGEKGFVWYDYNLFAQMHHTAMVLYDKPDNTPAASYPPNSLAASAGAYSDRIQVSWDAVKNADY